jgi:hypothetical protein
MTPQFANQVMSSFLLFLDNKVGIKGSAYRNVGTNFYPITSNLTNYVTYAAPYKQILSDQSIGGRVFTGIYVNNNLIGTGVSGFVSMNYDEGQLYFSSPLSSNTTISGNYSIKDFNFFLTDLSEEEILFKNKYSTNPKPPQTMSGLSDNQVTYPCVFLNNIGIENSPYEFGGNELTTIKVQAIVLADSQYKLDAINSILSDTVRLEVPILNNNEYPFDNYGNYKSGIVYNYTGLVANKIPTAESIYIMDTVVGTFNKRVINEFKRINPEIYPGIAEFELVKMRRPR